jgi:hypothetical protein
MVERFRAKAAGSREAAQRCLDLAVAGENRRARQQDENNKKKGVPAAGHIE